jgi:hypothetical protein
MERELVVEHIVTEEVDIVGTKPRKPDLLEPDHLADAWIVSDAHRPRILEVSPDPNQHSTVFIHQFYAEGATLSRLCVVEFNLEGEKHRGVSDRNRLRADGPEDSENTQLAILRD